MPVRLSTRFGDQSLLYRVPERRVDDGVVLTRVAKALVHDLPAVDAVLQHRLKSAAGERPATGPTAMPVDPCLADNALAIQLPLERSRGAKIDVALVDRTNRLCLCLVHDELLVIDVVSEGWQPAQAEARLPQFGR